MTSPAFTVQTSADSGFRQLLAEVAGRYAEIMGASPAECEALTRALADRVEALADGRATTVELACTPLAHGIDVTIRADGRSDVLHHPLGAAKS
jgi:hypothetical protein